MNQVENFSVSFDTNTVVIGFIRATLVIRRVAGNYGGFHRSVLVASPSFVRPPLPLPPTHSPTKRKYPKSLSEIPEISSIIRKRDLKQTFGTVYHKSRSDLPRRSRHVIHVQYPTRERQTAAVRAYITMTTRFRRFARLCRRERVLKNARKRQNNVVCNPDYAFQRRSVGKQMFFF